MVDDRSGRGWPDWAADERWPILTKGTLIDMSIDPHFEMPMRTDPASRFFAREEDWPIGTDAFLPRCSTCLARDAIGRAR
jgi:hypothetical protein